MSLLAAWTIVRPALILALVLLASPSTLALGGSRVAVGASPQDAGFLHRYDGATDTICTFSLAQMMDRRLADGTSLIEIVLSAGVSGAGPHVGCTALTFSFASETNVWGAALATPGAWAHEARDSTDLCGGADTIRARADPAAEAGLALFGLRFEHDRENWCDGSFSRLRVTTQAAP